MKNLSMTMYDLNAACFAMPHVLFKSKILRQLQWFGSTSLRDKCFLNTDYVFVYINQEDTILKIGIITFHFTTNQGAVLQCYALKTWLEKHGHEVQVINYRPAYHMVRYAPKKNPFIAAMGAVSKLNSPSFSITIKVYLRSFARSIISSLQNTDVSKYEKFEAFCNAYLNETKPYKSLDQLKKDPPMLDMYISGSDQLWNPDLLDAKFDASYFLNFGDSSTRRITYAVSAKETYTQSQKSEIGVLCKPLDAISIRETNQDIIDYAGKPVKVCIDPTLLLDEIDYKIIEADCIENTPYLFVYGFENIERINEAVSIISRTLGLKVINGCPHRIKLTMDNEKVYDYGPTDFLSYISNAEYIVTNSFHATAFSIIMKKRFIVVPHSSRGKRMTELLSKLGIEERIWTGKECLWDAPINYNLVYNRLHTLREDSESFLLTQVGKDEENMK